MTTAVQEIAEHELQLVVFRLASEIYGVDIALIHEIIRLREVTRVPLSAPDIEGVINLRGKIVPVLDLRKRLDLPAVERTGATRIIVMAFQDNPVGVIVDGVDGVLRLPESRIEPPSQLISDLDTDFIRGVGKVDEKLIILLDMAKTLNRDAL